MMELREQVEELVSQANLEFPVTILEVVTEFENVGGGDETLAVLERLNPEYVIEDRMQLIDLFEDPDYLAGEELDYGGHTLDYDELEDELD